MKFINFGTKITKPYLEKCCRRFPLKTGCRIVVWYSLVSSVLVGMVYAFYNLLDVTYPKYPKGRFVAAALVDLKIIFCILDVTFSTFLLAGFYLEGTTCFLYWLIAKSILLLCQVPLYILMSSFDKLCSGLAFLLIFMGLDVYSVLVVHGYLMEVSTVSASGESEV